MPERTVEHPVFDHTANMPWIGTEAFGWGSVLELGQGDRGASELP